jgi:hypothetical protein
MQRLGLSIVAASLLALMGVAPAAHAAPPAEQPSAREQKRERHPAALKWLDEAQRTRLRQVEPIVVIAEPIAKSEFGFDLAKTCTKFASWKRGTAKPPAAIEATRAGLPIADRMAALGDDPVATVLLARELSDTIAGLNQVCTRIRSRQASAEDFVLLRKAYANGFGSALDQLYQLYDKARKPLEQLLDRTAAYTTEEMLTQKQADYAALAATFVEEAELELAGERSSAFSATSLGAAARTAFEGLAEFLIDRAKEEAITFLRQELVNRICAEDADPILFIPNTCKMLARVDPNMSITAMGAALRTAMTSDLELFPDRAMVLAWTFEPEFAYSGTGTRILVPLVRDARARKSPLEFIAGLHTIATVDCERLAGPGHEDGEQRCADTVALLRMSSMLIHATMAQTSIKQKSPDLPYLTLATMFALEQRFVRMPEVARARILADLGWEKFVFAPEHVAAFESLVAEADSLIPALEKAIDALAEEVTAGDRPAILDEEMYRLAIRATRDLTSLGQLMLTMAPSTDAGGEWRKSMAVELAGLSDRFALAQAYADQDWAAATLGTLAFVEQWFESRGRSEAFVRYSQSLQALTRYLPLFIEIANAKSSDEVNRALQAAFPAGGYKRKYREPALSLNGFLGIYGGSTLSSSLDAGDQTQFGSLGGEFSMFAPIGMHVTSPVGVHRKRPSNVGVLFSVIDLGAITTSKWLEQEVNPEVASGAGTTQTELGEPSAFNIAGIVAPGAYFTVGIANSPFVFGLGASFGPFAQKRTVTGRDSMGDIESTNAAFLPVVRFGAFLAVDITFVSFGLR